jgi:hypothetical protein
VGSEQREDVGVPARDDRTGLGLLVAVVGWGVVGAALGAAGYGAGVVVADEGRAWHDPRSAVPWVLGVAAWWVLGPVATIVLLRAAGQARGAQTGLALWGLAPLAFAPCLVIVVIESSIGVVPGVLAAVATWCVALPFLARTLATADRRHAPLAGPSSPELPPPAWPAAPSAAGPPGPPIDPTLPPVQVPHPHPAPPSSPAPMPRPGADGPAGPPMRG